MKLSSRLTSMHMKWRPLAPLTSHGLVTGLVAIGNGVISVLDVLGLFDNMSESITSIIGMVCGNPVG